jgi:hypothetical protein
VIVFDGDHTEIDKERLLGELAEADLFYGHGHGSSHGLELAPHRTTDDAFLFPDDWKDAAEARRRAGRGKAAAAVLDWCGSSGCTYAVSGWADQVFANEGSTGVWDLISGRKDYVQSP